MEYSDQVVRVISEAIAAAMKKVGNDTSRAIEEKLRNYKFSGDNIKQMSIGNTHILPQSIDNVHIRDASIDSAKVKDFAAEVANIANANIKSATIDTAQIRDLAAYTANIANANIKNATIKFAQIEGLTAGSALIQEAVGDKVMIADLAVTEANMVSLTLGSLVLKGKDGSFYSILVGEDGQVTTELKQIVNSDIKDLSLNAGEKLIEGSITAACLNVKEIFANKALIGAIKTANLDAAEITANKAFIEQLATSLIEAPEGTGLKLASQEFVSLHVPGELKNSSVTVDKNGVEITGGKIIMDASTAIDILSGGALNVNGGTVSLKSKAAMNIVSGTLNVQSGSSVNIETGGTFTIGSENFSINSSGNVTIKGTVYASAGEIGGLKIESTTLSKLNSTASSANSTANTAKTNIENVTNGTTAVPYVKSTAITISGNNMTVGANGKLTLQSNSGIVINTGSTFTIGSDNFKIDSSGNVTVKGTVNASAGVIGGLKIESTTLSDLSSTASTAKSTADTATTNIGKITDGTTAVPYVKSTAITISGNNMTVGANGKLTLQSNSGLTINTGGTFTIGSGNFSIDASGNVTMTGKVTASSGKIGGWNIDTDRLYAGSGASYVALNTNASYPAIWAGDGTYSNAPFRVYQDGSVYITSLYTLNNGVESKIDLRSSYWQGEAGYNGNITEVTSSTEGSTVTLTFKKRKGEALTVNFNKADLTGVKVGTDGLGSVYVVDASEKKVSDNYSINIPTGGISPFAFTEETKVLKTYVRINLSGTKVISQYVNEVNATLAYDAGYKAGQDSMGVILNINTGKVSVGESSIKSWQAQLMNEHYILKSDGVTGINGVPFSGSTGTYYPPSGISLQGDCYINWVSS